MFASSWKLLRPVRFPISGGISPPSRLDPSTRERSVVRLPSEGGMLPASRLWARSRCWMLGRLPSSWGIGPESWFPWRSRTSTAASPPSCAGMHPERTFLARKRNSTCDRPASWAGIGPLSWLSFKPEAASVSTGCASEAGIVPESWLYSSSRSSSCERLPSVGWDRSGQCVVVEPEVREAREVSELRGDRAREVSCCGGTSSRRVVRVPELRRDRPGDLIALELQDQGVDRSPREAGRVPVRLFQPR